MLDLTLRQILHLAYTHIPQALAYLIVLDNILMSAAKAAGWTKMENFLCQLIKFIFALIPKIPTPPPAAPLVLIVLCASLSGCFAAKVSGTGINVQDQAHFISVQANSFNAEFNSDD